MPLGAAAAAELSGSPQLLFSGSIFEFGRNGLLLGRNAFSGSEIL